MARYTKSEALKIEFFRSKIKELRYLDYEINLVEDQIDEVNFKIKRMGTSSKIPSGNKKKQYDKDKKWNMLITQKDVLLHKLHKLNCEKAYIDTILNSLSATTKRIAVDLLVKRYTAEKVKDIYFISNPYQAINDELRYLEVDKF